MAVKISAIFKLADKMSDRFDRIGTLGDKAMSKIESSAAKADKVFTRNQSSASKLASVYKNFEGNAEQLASAVQRGEKQLSSMEKTEGKTAATTFEYSTKLDAAKEAQESLEQAMTNANKAAQDYEKAVSNSASTAEELQSAEEQLDTATRELFEAFDKGANAALDLEEASEKAGKKLDDFAEEAEDAADKGKEFGDRTGNAIESLESVLAAAGIAKIVKEITASLLECSSAAEIVETSAAKLETLAGSNNMDMLSDQIYTISAASGQAQEDLYEVAYNAISAGTDVEKAAEITDAANKLATAGFTTSSSALSVLTTATNSYGKAAGSATDITDGLITVQNLGVTTVGELANSMGKSISTAAAYHISLNNLESAYISVTKAGISTQEGTTYINAMISELGKSGSDVAKILTEETGKSFGELMESGYSLADVLEIIYNKAGKNSEAMMNLWGSQTAAVASAAIVNQGLGEFNNNLEALQNSAGETEKAYKIMSDTTEFAHNKMKNSAENLKVSIGQALNPTMEKLYNTSSTILDSMAKFAKENPTVVRALTSIAIGIGAVTAGLSIATVAVKLFTTVTATLGITMSTALPILGAVAGAIALITFAASSANEKQEELTATAKEQAEELDKLNQKYDDAVTRYGRNSREASILKNEIDDLTETYENSAKTMDEYVDQAKERADKAESDFKEYKDSMKSIDDQRTSVYALIQKLEDLVEANDKTAASEQNIKAVIEELNKELPGLALNFDDVVKGGSNYVEIMKKAAEAKYKSDKQQQLIADYGPSKTAYENAQKNLTAAQEEYKKAREQAGFEYYSEAQASGPLGKHGVGWYKITGYTNGTVPQPIYTSDKDSEELEKARQEVSKAEEELKNRKGQYEDITNQWKEVEEAAENAAKHPIDSITAATAAIDKQKEAVQNLCNKYLEAYESAKTSYEGQFSFFEKVKMYHEGDEDLTTFEKSTVEEAQAALNSQLEYWETYNSNINEIKKLSASDLWLTQESYDKFMAHIQDGSEEAAGLAQSMVNNIKNGNTNSVAEVAQTYAKVKEQQEETAQTVAEWQTDFSKKLVKIQEDMKKTVDEMEMSKDAKNAAKKTIDAYAQGITDGMQNAVNKATEVSAAVKAALELGESNVTSGKNVKNLYAQTESATPKDFGVGTRAYGHAGYALGTDYASAGVHVVGEKGPELVLFKGGEEVVPADETAKILNNSSNNGGVPDSLPTVTHSDSDGGASKSEKTITLNINGAGSIKVDGSASKEEIVAIMQEQAKPIMMSILEDEITEEGDDSYDY